MCQPVESRVAEFLPAFSGSDLTAAGGQYRSADTTHFSDSHGD
jgi:hypothetical protein